MNRNDPRWKVSIWGWDKPEDVEVIKLDVPEAVYDLDYAEEIAETILRFVKQQRERLAELRGAN